MAVSPAAEIPGSTPDATILVDTEAPTATALYLEENQNLTFLFSEGVGNKDAIEAAIEALTFIDDTSDLAWNNSNTTATVTQMIAAISEQEISMMDFSITDIAGNTRVYDEISPVLYDII